MADIFSLIPFVGRGGVGTNWVMVAFWTFIILMICGGGMALFFILLWKKITTKTLEIDGETRRLRIFSGRIKKDKAGVEKYYARKLKKFLKRPQQRDFLLQGRRDVLMFLKDNNGLHHTLRVPTFEEIKEYYLKVKNVDISQEYILNEKEKEIKNPYYNVWEMFMLPNPHEDLNWLADQCAESDKEFKDTHWWQHPNIMVIGVAFICLIMVVMTLILAGKMI